MAELATPPAEGIVLAHFIVSDDVERSRRFYTEVLGGRIAFLGPGGLTYVALANSWIIINVGGGPTDDKPEVTLETPERSQPGQQLPQHPSRGHPRRVRRMERPGCSVPDAAEAAPVRDPLLHPRSRRSSDRSGADHGPAGDWTPDHWPSTTSDGRVRVSSVLRSELGDRRGRRCSPVLSLAP